MNSPWVLGMWFAAIVVAIPVVLWLLKRGPLRGTQGVAGLPRPVAVLPLSPTQRLVTVEVGRGEERLWLVLGVTPQSISTLHTMTPLASAAPPATLEAAPAATFHQLLSRLRAGSNGSGASKHER